MGEASQYSFNVDQLLILQLLREPRRAYPSTSIGDDIGITYERIMEVTGLTIEKTLLSLGWLEALDLVHHDVGIEQRIIHYLGTVKSLTHPGQRTVRLFTLTAKGRQIAQNLPPVAENRT